MILLLAFLSGVFGRMGGSGNTQCWYGRLLNNEWRRIGCSLLVVATCWHYLGGHPYIYLAVFLLHWGAFATYWQFLFKGVDNLWMSGAMVGLALYPIVFIDNNLFVFVLARSVLLGVVWGCLNKYLPQKGVILWRRDVAEEFSRYFVSL